MIRHGYTFIIAPHTAKPQKSFHIPAWLLNVLVSILMLTVSAVSLHVGNMLFQYKTMEDEVVPTREENVELHSTNDNLNGLLSEAYSSISELQARLAGERESYATGLAQITTKLLNLEKFAVDLKLMAGYRLESKEAKSLGTGGPVMDEHTFIQNFLAMPETRFVSAGKLTEKDLMGREVLLLSAMNETVRLAAEESLHPGGCTQGASRAWHHHQPVWGAAWRRVACRSGHRCPRGHSHLCPRRGRCDEAGPAGGYGNVIILDHGGGFTTRYGHMSRIKVKKGDKVDGGDVIGSVGHVGWATGNHLHYEVRLNGVPLDPSRYIPKGLPVQLMDGNKSMFNEGEVGSAIEEMDSGIQMEGDQFVPEPLEGDSSAPTAEVKSKPAAEKPAQPAPAPPAPEKKGD